MQAKAPKMVQDQDTCACMQKAITFLFAFHNNEEWQAASSDIESDFSSILMTQQYADSMLKVSIISFIALSITDIR